MNSRRIALVFVVFPVLYSQAFADMREDTLEAFGRCAAVADNTARLACYDRLAPRVKDALARPPATLDRTPTKQEQESWFGFNLDDLFGGGSNATTPEAFGKERTPKVQAAREHEEIESISSQLSEVSFTPFGQFIIFLANGQVWKQLQGDSARAHFRSKPTDNTVTISRGFLGSYNLSLNGSAEVFKVTRVK
jgi:hypothetical protein